MCKMIQYAKKSKNEKNHIVKSGAIYFETIPRKFDLHNKPFWPNRRQIVSAPQPSRVNR